MGENTVVEYYGARRQGYHCGYCGLDNGKHTKGMWAHSMTVGDYNDLIDRGWRRSGQYCYKPTMDKTCCPQYTIRCPVAKFKLNKSHKKVIKLVNRYLNTGVEPGASPSSGREHGGAGAAGAEHEGADIAPPHVPLPAGLAKSRTSDRSVDNTSSISSRKCDQKMDTDAADTSSGPGRSCDNHPAKAKSRDSKAEKKSVEKKLPKPGRGADPSKPPCKKAKLRRWEKHQEKRAEKPEQAATENSPRADKRKKGNEAKTLEDFLGEVSENPAHKLEIRLVRSSPQSQEFEETSSESHQVYRNYQMAIHHDPADKPTQKQFTRFLVDSPMQIRLVRSAPRSEAFKKSFAKSYFIYKKYQMEIHKDEPDECSESGYTRFLVDSPLKEEHKEEGGLPEGYGSFHQLYVLDGKIIAVGVIDILPRCVSSVYLYYDPAYSFLSLGTYTALRELAFTRQLGAIDADLLYYYMGFYIHTCPKMKYKGQYVPSFLLCPESYTWHAVEQCQVELDANKYSRFEPTDKEDENGEIELRRVLVLHQRQAMPYHMYRALNPDAGDKDHVKEYARLVGKACAERMLLYRP